MSSQGPFLLPRLLQDIICLIFLRSCESFPLSHCALYQSWLISRFPFIVMYWELIVLHTSNDQCKTYFTCMYIECRLFMMSAECIAFCPYHCNPNKSFWTIDFIWLKLSLVITFILECQKLMLLGLHCIDKLNHDTASSYHFPWSWQILIVEH